MGTDEREAIEGYGKFKVELYGGGTRIVVIPERITLEEMHRVIQALFDWEDEHLWEFRDAEGRCYKTGTPRGDGPFGREEKVIAPAKVCLSEVLPERGDKLEYTYDFGDSWRHVVTRMAPPKRGGRHCEKTTGPDGIEDCGGPWGLQESKGDWHVPDVGEITQRLQALRLHPKASGEGVVSREKGRLDEILNSLTEEEWGWLRTLGEDGIVRIPKGCGRVEELAGLLPGTRRAGVLWGGNTLHADSGFKRLWRKHRAEWTERYESGAADTGGNFSAKEKDRLWAFAKAAVNLYGVVGEADLRELARRWREDTGWGAFTPEELSAHAMDCFRKQEFSVHSFAYMRDGYVVSRAKYPPEKPDAAAAIASTLELREGKEWWHPATFADFMAWGRGYPDWPEEYGRLGDFIQATWDVDPSDSFDRRLLQETFEGVYDVLASGRGWEAAVDSMHHDFDMSKLRNHESMRLVELLAAASSATRHDANRGFTPSEMRAKAGPGNEFEISATPSTYFRTPNASIVRIRAKIGRNDPCPCGSGKKYKKCCGANAGNGRGT